MGRIIAWLLSAEAIVGAIALIQIMADTDNVAPTAFIILCVGIVVWSAKKAYQNSKPVIIYSLLIIGITGILSKFFIGDFIQFFTGLTPSLTWGLLVFVIGSSVMPLVFKKYK